MSTGLMAAGHNVLLAAAAKAGKTTFLLNLLRSLADGERFLGQYDATLPEGRIGIIDAEMSRNQYRQWLRDIRLRRGDRIPIWFLRGCTHLFQITETTARQRWSGYMREHGIKFLIIDPLLPFLAGNGLDENSSTDVARFTAALDQMCAEGEVTDLVVAHHYGHAGNRGRGSSRLQDWPDVLWFLERDEITGERSFRAYGRDVEVPTSVLTFEETTRLLTIPQLGVSPEQSRERHRAHEIERKVLAVVEAEPGLSSNEVLARLDTGRTASLSALHQLVEIGMIVQREGARNAKRNYLPEDHSH